MDKEKALKLMEDLAERLIQAADEPGYTFTIDVEAKLCEPEEPKKRKIDGDEFMGWHFDKNGHIRNKKDDLPIAYMDSIPAKVQRRSPEIMRALIDIVSTLRDTRFLPQHRDVLNKAQWLISDMGFGCDIEGAGICMTSKNSDVR